MSNNEMTSSAINGFDVIEQGNCSFADATKLVARANSLAIGGHRDWVLPDLVTTQALRLVSGGGHFCAWSSSPYVGGSGGAWGVYFGNGDVRDHGRYNGLRVRLVRASQSLSLGRAAHQKSIEEGQKNMQVYALQPARPIEARVQDVSTGSVNGFDVIEQGNCSFADATKLVARANSLAIGGHRDWVLPDLVTTQALRLVSGGRDFSAWTSSLDAGATGLLWCVDFTMGHMELLRDSGKKCVSLVRESQSLELGEAGHRISLAEAGIVTEGQDTQDMGSLPTNEQIESRIGCRLPASGFDAIRALMAEHSASISAIAETGSAIVGLMQKHGEFADLHPKEENPGNRVLVVVSGGVADPVCDAGVDVEVFDWDSYDADPEGKSGVPSHFADLAEGLGIPVCEVPMPVNRPRP